MTKNNDSNSRNEIIEKQDNSYIKAENSECPIPMSNIDIKEESETSSIKQDLNKKNKPIPADWKVIPPSDTWCPDFLSKHDPRLIAYPYINNYSQQANTIDGWKVLGATRRGNSHADYGTHREDAFGFQMSKGFAISCIADGAGSSRFSRIGAHIVCREMVERLSLGIRRLIETESEVNDEHPVQVAPFQKIVGEEVLNVCNYVKEIADKSMLKPKDFRCTLLLTALIQIRDRTFIIATQVGDGAILSLNFDGETKILIDGDSGEFAGEVSCFIPDSSAPENAAQKLVIFDASEISTLLMCSDGIEDPFYPMAKNPAPIFQQLYGGVVEPLNGFNHQASQRAPLCDTDAETAIETWLNFKKRGENDDRTILICYRDPLNVDPDTLRYRRK